MEYKVKAEGTMVPSSAEEMGLNKSVFIGHVVIQTTAGSDSRKSFFDLTLCHSCEFNHSTLSRCKSCNEEFCGVCWGLETKENIIKIKCPGCSEEYKCIDKESAPALIDNFKERAFKNTPIIMECSFCDGEQLHIVSIEDEKLNEGKGEAIGYCGLSTQTERSETTDTISMANLLQHITGTHLNMTQRASIGTGKWIVTNLPLSSKWVKSLILSNKILGIIKAANEEAPVAIALRPECRLESSPSTSIHQYSAHSNDQPETHVAKKQCLQNYDVVSYLNLTDKTVEDKKQEGSISKNKMSVSIPFNIKDHSYMTRPITFQDVDHRMLLTIKTLSMSSNLGDLQILYHMLDMVGKDNPTLPWIISQHILHNDNTSLMRCNKDFTLEELRGISERNNFRSYLDHIDQGKITPQKLTFTNSKSVLDILSKSWEELEGIDDLDINYINIAAIKWGLRYGEVTFFIYLFHMICQPEDRQLIDWMNAEYATWDSKKAMKNALEIYQKLKKQNRPISVIYEAMEYSNYLYGGFEPQLEKWVKDNQHLIKKQSVKAANGEAPPVAMAQRLASIPEICSPSTSIHQYSAQSNDHPGTNVAEKQLLQNFNVASQLNQHEKPIKEENKEGANSTKTMPVSKPFDISDLSYMNRPITFQDVDHRMLMSIRELKFSLYQSQVEKVFNILGMYKYSSKTMIWMISQHILRRNLGSRRGQILTLSDLYSIIETNFSASVSAIFDVPQKTPRKPKVTDDKAILNILSKSSNELEAIASKQDINTINISAIEWGLENAEEDFFMVLFHMVCQPEDYELISWIGTKGNGWDETKALSKALVIYSKLKEQGRPIGVIYEALHFAGVYGGFDERLKDWVEHKIIR